LGILNVKLQHQKGRIGHEEQFGDRGNGIGCDR
jgi:hypothetical protein